MRANRIPKNAGCSSKEEVKKCDRGYTKSRLSDDKINLIQWKDNSLVTVGSNCYGVETARYVKRYSASAKRYVQVKCPGAILEYNKNMGGTDRMDEDINCYRIGVRGKKWYWSIFTWLIDASINNAWNIYKMSHENISNISNLHFRRELVTHYLSTLGSEKNKTGRPSKDVNVSTRYINPGHLIQIIASSKRRRCRAEGCTSIVNTECSKCNVGLCIKCFSSYHTK